MYNSVERFVYIYLIVFRGLCTNSTPIFLMNSIQSSLLVPLRFLLIFARSFVRLSISVEKLGDEGSTWRGFSIYVFLSLSLSLFCSNHF